MTEPDPVPVRRTPAAGAAGRPRDASGTRSRLLEAARRRFAQHGYSGTTVREIAADAGVNLALINRYFTSKEGLFETCLRQAVDDLEPPAAERSVEQAAERIVARLTALPVGTGSLPLLLLLRSSGDEGADRVRRDTLASFAAGIAGASGRDEAPGREALLLRAQIILSTVLGIALLRSSTALEPLSSASPEDLRGPVADLIATLLPAAPDAPS